MPVFWREDPSLTSQADQGGLGLCTPEVCLVALGLAPGGAQIHTSWLSQELAPVRFDVD